MRSVADELRHADRRSQPDSTPWERMQAALKAGRFQVETFARFQGISLSEAQLRVENQRQRGRRRSRAAEPT